MFLLSVHLGIGCNHLLSNLIILFSVTKRHLLPLLYAVKMSVPHFPSICNDNAYIVKQLQLLDFDFVSNYAFYLLISVNPFFWLLLTTLPNGYFSISFESVYSIFSSLFHPIINRNVICASCFHKRII